MERLSGQWANRLTLVDSATMRAMLTSDTTNKGHTNERKLFGFWDYEGAEVRWCFSAIRINLSTALKPALQTTKSS
ncbi:hypothetical protein [uncultured Helicobacter sp.]|uniref:hypothetical protein n=1 Tax=uncultured Helicobacter sp. TaxID=175537 RepID=UPI0026187CB4|nr:hypothetical protein [uncultured Helicobacter sp.]